MGQSIIQSVCIFRAYLFVCPYFCSSFYLSRSVCLSFCQSSSLPILPSVSLYANYFPSCQFHLCSPIRRLLSDPWGSSPDLRCHTSTPVSANTDTNSLSSEKHGQVPQAAKQDSDFQIFQIFLFLCTIYNNYNIKSITEIMWLKKRTEYCRDRGFDCAANMFSFFFYFGYRTKKKQNSLPLQTMG